MTASPANVITEQLRLDAHLQRRKGHDLLMLGNELV
jgi:hypothetical protein